MAIHRWALIPIGLLAISARLSCRRASHLRSTSGAITVMEPPGLSHRSRSAGALIVISSLAYCGALTAHRDPWSRSIAATGTASGESPHATICESSGVHHPLQGTCRTTTLVTCCIETESRTFNVMQLSNSSANCLFRNTGLEGTARGKAATRLSTHSLSRAGS